MVRLEEGAALLTCANASRGGSCFELCRSAVWSSRPNAQKAVDLRKRWPIRARLRLLLSDVYWS
jgi:hypothetical protein